MINLKKTITETNKQKNVNQNEKSPLFLINEIARIEFERISKAENTLCDFNESARLILIKIGDNEGCSQQFIVKETHKKKPTVSLIMSRFEKEGYIVREVDTIDHRATHLMLTEKGRDTVTKLKSFFREEENRAVDGVTVNEYEMLVRLLSRMKTNLTNE